MFYLILVGLVTTIGIILSIKNLNFKYLNISLLVTVCIMFIGLAITSLTVYNNKQFVKRYSYSEKIGTGKTKLIGNQLLYKNKDNIWIIIPYPKKFTIRNINGKLYIYYNVFHRKSNSIFQYYTDDFVDEISFILK